MKKVVVALLALACCAAIPAAFAVSGMGSVFNTVTEQMGAAAKLITAGAYVVGMAFAVGAIAKFKAHKDNPTQIPIGTPIALLFVAAGLLFAPTVFKVASYTLFGASGNIAGVSGVTTFGINKAA